MAQIGGGGNRELRGELNHVASGVMGLDCGEHALLNESVTAGVVRPADTNFERAV